MISTPLGNYINCHSILFNQTQQPQMKILFTLLTVLFSIAISAQSIQGTYNEGKDMITFNDNRVDFNVRGNDGLGVIYCGEGTYEIIDGYIVISTVEYKGSKTRVEMNPSAKKDTVQLQFLDNDGYSLKGIRAEFLNKSGKTLSLSISDDNGIVLYKTNPKVTAIKVADLLFDKTTFDFVANNDYTVHLVKNRILEDKTVIFKLIDNTDDKLSLKLLSTDFNNSNPTASYLKKLENKTKATIDRARLFEKAEL